MQGDIIDYLKGEAANSSIRISAYGDWTREISPRLEGVIVTHSYLIDKYIRNEIRPPQGEQDLMKPVTRLERNFKVEISDRDSISKIIEDCEATDTRMCYTDGSKSQGGTGYGYVIKTSRMVTPRSMRALVDSPNTVRFTKLNCVVSELEPTTF